MADKIEAAWASTTSTTATTNSDAARRWRAHDGAGRGLAVPVQDQLLVGFLLPLTEKGHGLPRVPRPWFIDACASALT